MLLNKMSLNQKIYNCRSGQTITSFQIIDLLVESLIIKPPVSNVYITKDMLVFTTTRKRHFYQTFLLIKGATFLSNNDFSFKEMTFMLNTNVWIKR